MRAFAIATLLLGLAAVSPAAPPAPPTPAPVNEVVYARPFALNDGFQFTWCKEPFQVSQGTLLVLKVNPDLVIPRQTEEPILYVGNQSAMRLNHGNESGYVIAVVPGDVDLTKDPIWFGTPGLPERVDAATIRAEREKADKAGIKPISAEQAQAARSKGGERINVPDMSAMLRGPVSGLIEQYSPQEKRLSEAWQLPTVKPASRP